MVITELLEKNARLYGEEISLVEINPSEARDRAVTWRDYSLIESAGTDAPYRRELSWSEFDKRANRFANLLLSRGLKKGTKVGILLMNYPTVLAEPWYSGIGLPWIPDLLQSQRVGGGVAWAMGEIPLFIVMIALAWQWYQSDMREARRSERQADRDDDAELKAYNEMLAQMAKADRRH